MATQYKFLTVSQVAALLGFDRSYVKRLCQTGKFPNTQRLGDFPNSPYAIPEKDVEAFRRAWRPRHRKEKAG